ncbi:hypothetical protein AX17_003097 [Amanita inopinata Kibby_2008]|nr:hypothetical protein AX17_003097 [Amanita inopinata Kibby_2008]
MFTTKGHVRDQATPGFYCTGDSNRFLQDVFRMEPCDLLQKFEQWARAYDPTLPKVDTFRSMRMECTALINDGLRKLCKLDNINMNYVNYDKAIVQKYRVKLVGWPQTIPFTTPSNLSSVDHVRTLRHMLKTNACQWTQLSEREVEEHMENIIQRELAGEVVSRKRKQRSDKGRNRKKVAIDENHDEQLDENDDKQLDEGSKQARQRIEIGRFGKISKSKAYISSEEEDEQDEQDDCDNSGGDDGSTSDTN